MKLFQKQQNEDSINVLPEEERKREIIGSIGKQGSGKSYKIKEQLSILLKSGKFKKVLIIDPMGEYNEKDLKKHKLPNFKLIDNLKELIDYMFANKEFRIVYQPLYIQDEITSIGEAVYTLANVVLVVEEIDLIIPQKSKPSPVMLKLIQRGRHRAITIYWTTQTPAEVNKLLIKNTNTFYVFKVTEKNDLSYLTFMRSDLKEKIPNLAKYEFIEIK
ncbi:ATP-binding protein [Candidatus Pacearchaeota archaeon]|nr:ATP-binding protein [Candidatus Pacearchaeota archaeon]